MSQLDTMKEAARLREALERIEAVANVAWNDTDGAYWQSVRFRDVRDIARAALQPEIPSEPPVSGGDFGAPAGRRG